MGTSHFAGTGDASPSDIYGREIYVECVRTTYRRRQRNLLSHFIVSGLPLTIGWIGEARAVNLLLISLLWTYALVGLYFTHRFNSSAIPDREVHRWGRALYYLMVVLGILYNLIFFNLAFHGVENAMLYLLLTTALFSAGAVSSYQHLKWLGPLFVFAAMAPQCVYYMTAGIAGGAFTAFLIAVFIAFITNVGLELHKDAIRTLSLNFELKAAKETAESATRMKDQFISLVSHDLRSPLSGIVGTLQVMTKSDIYDMDREFVKKGIRAACESGESLYGFVQKLLDISRLQTGDIQPLMRNIITKPFIDSLIIRINPLAAQKGIFFENAIAGNHKIFGDPELMGQVISNLLSNAVKFSSKGDTVTVLSPGNRNGCVAVEDIGTGIPNGFLPDLFRHEVKTISTGTEGEQGTGLGLPHSADIVKAHGGELTVESKEGNGAVFTVTLPHPDAYVLVVDDQPAHREMMKEHIGHVNGAGVIEAENGHEALILLRGHIPDVIITDLNMPQMDGFELIKKIRRMNGLKEIPVIAASSLDWLDKDAHEKTRKKVLEIGANDFVAKPINGEAFKKLIRSYLS